MTADAISTTAQAPASAAAAPTAKSVVAGFDALLAALFGARDATATPGATAQPKAAADDADKPSDADAGAVSILGAAMTPPQPVLLQVTTIAQGAADADGQGAGIPVGQVLPTPQAILAANIPTLADVTTPDPSTPSRAAATPSPVTPPPASGAADDIAATIVASRPDAAPGTTQAPAPATAEVAVSLAPAPRPVLNAARPEPKVQAARDAAAAPSADAVTAAPARAADAPIVALASVGGEQAFDHPDQGAAHDGPAPALKDPAATPASAAFQTETTAAPSATPPPASLPRAGPATVPHLATQIAGAVAAKSTQFDIALDPAGLGKVDVRVQIAPDGALTASLAFATPHAANELRARAGELQQALQQAGFDLAEGALSFDVSSQGGGGQNQARTYDAWQDGATRSFATLDDLAGAPAAQAYARPAGTGGVDIRI